MNRPVYTVLYSLMIVAIFFTLSVVYQSCGKNKKNTPSSDELAEKVEEVADNYTEESFFEDEDDQGASDPDAEKELTSQVSSQTSNSNTYEPKSSSSLSNGFMVIAGNYLLENNATAMVKKLRAAGYNNAEKVVFDLSQYYTVIAGSYESRSVANSISSELSGKGIDNYVLRRKK